MCRYDGTFTRALPVLLAFVGVGCESEPSPISGTTPDARATVGNPHADGGQHQTEPPSTGVDAAGTTACAPALARCDAPGDTCCSGTTCIETDGVKRCVETCETRFDCGSLCCQPDSTGRRLCVASDRCPPIPCSDVGGQCDGPGFSCCSGLTCVSSPSPDYGGCRKPCSTGTECDTGCCVPFSNGASGFCAAKSACECGVENGPCGGTKHCCTGFSCTSVDTPGAFVCKPTCTKSADCASKCCALITGTPESACLPAAFCPPP